MTTDHPRAQRSPRSHVAPAVAFAGWIAFSWFLLAQARAGPAIIWNDSKVYAEMATRPLWSSSFWAGTRPPLFPLLIKGFGPSTGLLAAQAVIGAAAWGVLAWTVGRLAPPGWLRTLASLVVLAVATALPVTMWNRSVLSESVAMSALALVFAAFIWLSREMTWPRIAATIAACLCFAASRDAQVWTVVLLSVAVGVYAMTQLRSNRQVAGRAAALVACLLTVAALTEWGAIASHRTTQDVTDVLYVRVFPYPDRVAWFAAHGMPQQKQIEGLAARAPTQADGARLVAFDRHDPAFRPLEQWILADGATTYLLWLTTHPWYVVTEPLQRPERAFNSAQGNLTFYAATSHRMDSPLTVVMWPPLLELGILSTLAISLAILSGVWRERPWTAVLVLTAIGMVAMLVAWHGDGQEVTRHTVEGFAEVRLGVWILLTIGVTGVVELRRRDAQIGSLGRATTAIL